MGVGDGAAQPGTDPPAVLQDSMTSWATCGSGQHLHTRLLSRTCVSFGGPPGSTQLMVLPITGPGSPPGEELGSWGLRVWVLFSQSTGSPRAGAAAASTPRSAPQIVGRGKRISSICHEKQKNLGQLAPFLAMSQQPERLCVSHHKGFSSPHN